MYKLMLLDLWAKLWRLRDYTPSMVLYYHAITLSDEVLQELKEL